MKIIQVFNSRIRKRGSFEDYMIELARQTKARGIGLQFVFPAMETFDVQQELKCNGADVSIIKESWGSFSYL